MTRFFIALSLILTTSAVFADSVAPSSVAPSPAIACAKLAETAAATVEANFNGVRLQDLTALAKVTKKTTTSLVFSVEVFEQFSDGSSTVEFPSTYYSVVANRTEANCRIVSVKKVR